MDQAFSLWGSPYHLLLGNRLKKKIEKIDQRLIIQPLRGGNLLYIT